MSSLDTNSKGLQKLLGCTQQQLQRFVRKVPRCVVPAPFWRDTRMVLSADAVSATALSAAVLSF